MTRKGWYDARMKIESETWPILNGTLCEDGVWRVLTVTTINQMREREGLPPLDELLPYQWQLLTTAVPFRFDPDP